MDRLERRQHELHAQLPAFARTLDWTRQLIDDAMQKIETPYLALSGGVDSQVLLDLLWRAGYRMPVRWSDDGYDYPETLACLQMLIQAYQLDFHAIRNLHAWQRWCEEMDRPDLCDDPAALEAWGNPHEWTETRTAAQHQEHQQGYTGVFLGLLAKESRARSYALQSGYKALYQVKSEGGMWHCSPLAAWDKRDVWAYVTKYNLPYNAAYARLAALGVPLERRRVAPLTCFRTAQYGSVAVLRQGWPELYNRLATTFPGVRAYA